MFQTADTLLSHSVQEREMVRPDRLHLSLLSPSRMLSCGVMLNLMHLDFSCFDFLMHTFLFKKEWVSKDSFTKICFE